jgi:hypothetical protein
MRPSYNTRTPIVERRGKEAVFNKINELRVKIGRPKMTRDYMDRVGLEALRKDLACLQFENAAKGSA